MDGLYGWMKNDTPELDSDDLRSVIEAQTAEIERLRAFERQAAQWEINYHQADNACQLLSAQLAQAQENARGLVGLCLFASSYFPSDLEITGFKKELEERALKAAA